MRRGKDQPTEWGGESGVSHKSPRHREEAVYHSKCDRMSPFSVTLCPPNVLQGQGHGFFKLTFFKDSIYNLTKPVAFRHPMARLQTGGALQTPTGAVSTSRSWKEASSHHLPLRLAELRTSQNCPFRAPCPLSRHSSEADSCMQWALRCCTGTSIGLLVMQLKPELIQLEGGLPRSGGWAHPGEGEMKSRS